MNNPYQILGLSRKAELSEIKATYRKLAKQYHPDKTAGSKDSKAKYDAIRQAYEILSDPKNRRLFDQGFIDGAGKKTKPKQKFDFSASQNAKKDLFSFLKKTANTKASKPSTSGYKKGDISYYINLSESEALSGCDRVINLDNGKKLKVKIPKRTLTGDKIRIKNVNLSTSETGPQNFGDVLININILSKQNKLEKIVGKDVYLKFPISLPEAINGAKIKLQTHGGEVVVNINKLTSSNTKLRIRGKGLQAKSGGLNGDLFLEIVIVLPNKLPAELHQAIAKIPDYGEALRK